MVENDAARGQNTPAKKIHRSPNYPMFSLRTAIEKAKLVYQHEKRNFTTAAVIQRDIGYKEGTGPAGRAVSALRQYGLLEERSGTYGVTDVGFLFTYAEENAPERQAALRESALKPMIFRELIEQFPSGLPSDGTLRSYLIGKRGFNPTAVDEFIAVFKETMELANVVPGVYTPGQPSQDSGGGEQMETPIAPIGAGGQPAKTPMGIHIWSWSLSIPRNVRAELKLTGTELKVEDVRRLKKQIESLEEAFEDSGDA